ncbi:MAG: hypothetical protein HKN05_07700, partial [Rhizobiales bacterium]|nr:hypothetical protein [Hyphomicrobiales bacterium]
ALRHGTEFALTVLPSDVQVDRKTLAEIKSRFPGLNPDLTRINRLMGEFASREGIPILETLMPLLDARDSGQMDLHYTIFDSHMTPKSHRVLAKALAEQLLTRGMIRAQK